MRYNLEHSVVIARPPADVYDLVRDVARTGEWSVQTYLCEWDGAARGVGATFSGHNRTTEQEWTTVSRIVVDNPGVEFGWVVTSSDVRWGYRLRDAHEDDGAGSGSTLLTHYTVFEETADRVFGELFGDDALAQITVRLTAAATGIPVTLDRIKQIVESA